MAAVSGSQASTVLLHGQHRLSNESCLLQGYQTGQGISAASAAAAAAAAAAAPQAAGVKAEPGLRAPAAGHGIIPASGLPAVLQVSAGEVNETGKSHLRYV